MAWYVVLQFIFYSGNKFGKEACKPLKLNGNYPYRLIEH
jgi:hypothetical protein